MKVAQSPASLWQRAAPFLLALGVVIAYLPSQRGGFLNWDDPWLYVANKIIQDRNPHVLVDVWSNFSRATRVVLGAEYLPVRDTELWLELRVFGLSPHWLRLTNLGIYVAAVLFARRAFLALLPGRVSAEIAAWIFALHPAHVESVAWLAGRKDVLSMCFVAAALAVHAGSSRHRVVSIPVLLALAHFSKSMSVSAVGLFVASDLLLRRKPELRIYLPATLIAFGAFLVHRYVGGIVGIVQEPLGGSRATQLATMGPVWLGYIAALAYPPSLSLVHDVVVRSGFDLLAIGGYACLGAWLTAGVVLWRRGVDRVTLASFIWFFVPLVPVSQVLFPLQSQMADRYLYLSVLAPALVVGVVAERFAPRGLYAAGALNLVLAGATAWRSSLFASSVDVFRDALDKTELTPVPAYQLALALEESGDVAGAERAYRETLRRVPGRDETGRRATNNLARLLAHQGRWLEAERVLRDGREHWPDDPKLLGNLIRVLVRIGHVDEARALELKLRESPRLDAAGTP